MIEPALPPLSEWETFYVITGSSAAALTGLMFVVVALRAEAMAAVRTDEADRAFSTPTIVHFCAVLLLAALLSTPGHTPRTLAACVGAAGVAGIAVTARVAALARRQKLYAMVLSDWTWHVAVPLVAYAAVVTAAGVLLRRPAAALYVVAGSALLLLFVGIHNAWDSALYIAVHRLRREPVPAGPPVTRRIVRDGAAARRLPRRPRGDHMLTDALTNPTVKAAVEALQRGDREGWSVLFERDATLYDDGSPRDLEEFARDALGHERFTAIEHVSGDGLGLVGAFHSDRWGDFHTYFTFRLSAAGKIARLDIGQAEC